MLALFLSFLFSFAQPFLNICLSDDGALYASTVARVVLHARARTHYTCARVNYELRKIVSEDDLDTQRAARKGIDVRRASFGSFMSPRREGEAVGR